MADKNFFNIFGGLDSRDSFGNEKTGTVLFMTECKNIDIYGTNVRRARGQTQKLQITGTSILGLSQHEVDGVFGIRAITGDGHYYRIDPNSGDYTEAKTGLSTSAKPYFFQYDSKLVCLTGYDDPFVDTGSAITQTGFYNQYTKYGTCGCAFHGHTFIADGKLLAWSAANTTDDWTTEGDAGYKDNFNGNIVDLKVFSSYMVIFTTSDVYILSGYDNSSFAFEHWSPTGSYSKDNNCYLDNKLYTWNKGLYPIESTGDLAQVRIQNPLSYRITPSLFDVDKTRSDEIIMVGYEDRKQIWTYVPVENETGLYRCWVANFINYEDKRIIAFYPREGNPITCACAFDGKVLTGTSDGKVYQEDLGDTFDGNVIESLAWFSPINFGSSRLKGCEDFKAWFSAFSANKCSFMFRYDGEYSNPDDTDVDLLDIHDDYFVLDDSELDGDNALAVGDKVSEVISVMDEFTSVQFGIKTENAGEDFIFYGGSFMGVKLINEY